MRVRHLCLTVASAAFIALAAEAGARAENAADQAGRRTTAGNLQPEHVDLLPLIQVDTPPQNARSSPIGGYVRFFVYDPSQAGHTPPVDREPRLYSSEHRDWFSRWLIGRSFSRLLTLKLAVSRPNISATTTLASSVLQSSRSVGETWNSEVNGRRYLTPYLRVDPDTLVSIEVNMNAATQVQANITRAVLDVVTRAVSLVQPTAQLVTSLNEERFRQTSDFVDQSVSTLFAQNLVERISNEFGPGEWTGEPLVHIAAQFPMNRRLLQEQHYSNVGLWRVAATPARVSMFSHVELAGGAGETVEQPCQGKSGYVLQACRAFIGLTPHRVLGLEMGENLTLGEALLADSAIASELPRFLGPDGGAQDAARRLCNLVASKAEELGLNGFDAAAAVWAFGQVMQVNDQRRGMLFSEGLSCRAGRLAKEVGLA